MQLTVDDDRRRSRVTTLFRPLLAVPHVAWLALWTIPAILAALANGVVVLVTGSSAAPLHGFLAAYVRYQAQLNAFAYLVANPFPGFTGTLPYPVDLAVAGPTPQRRWNVLLRPLLAVPALLAAGVLSLALGVLGAAGWVAALITGRMPVRLRDPGASCVRFLARTHAYWLLLTDAHPYSRRRA